MKLSTGFLAIILICFCSCKSLNNGFYKAKKNVAESMYNQHIKGTTWQLMHIDSAGTVHNFPIEPVYELKFIHIKYKKEKGEIYAIGRLFVKTEIENRQSVYYCKDNRSDYKINVQTGEMHTQILYKHLFLFANNLSLHDSDLAISLFYLQNSISRLQKDGEKGILKIEMFYSRGDEVKMHALLKEL